MQTRQKGGYAMLLYHASGTAGIKTLEPRISNHGRALVYFSQKRENTLVYLSNAIERYCKSVSFEHKGPWQKWASYGFTKDGRLLLEEYYENALDETYKGVSGYIYSVRSDASCVPQGDIPYACTSGSAMPVAGCEFVEDAYAALIEAESAGLICIRRYAELSKSTLAFIERVIPKEYANAQSAPDYRLFLRAKFKDILRL